MIFALACGVAATVATLGPLMAWLASQTDEFTLARIDASHRRNLGRTR